MLVILAMIVIPFWIMYALGFHKAFYATLALLMCTAIALFFTILLWLLAVVFGADFSIIKNANTPVLDVWTTAMKNMPFMAAGVFYIYFFPFVALVESLLLAWKLSFIVFICQMLVYAKSFQMLFNGLYFIYSKEGQKELGITQ